MFASCDDRGSTPSGGSGLAVTIDLPTRTDYPSSGFQVILVSADTDSPSSVLAGSVKYTAAVPATDDSEGQNAYLTVTGIPSGSYSGSVYVQYASTLKRLMQGVAGESSSTIGNEVSLSVVNFTDITPQTIDVTITAPDAKTVLPADASSYPLTLTPAAAAAEADGEPTSYVLLPNGAPKITAAEGETPASAALSYTASYEPIKGLVAPIAGENMTASVSISIGGGTYAQNSSVQVTLTPGSTTAAKSNITLKELQYGEVNVALPDTLNGEQIVEKTNPAYSYTSVSYVLKSGSEVLAEGTAAPKNGGSASDPQWSFSIAGVLAQPSGTAAGYVLSVSLVDADGNTWLAEGENTSVASAPSEGAPVSAGAATVTKFVEQVATLQVNLTDLATLPTGAEPYTVSYIESDKSGKPLAGAKTETYALTSKQASAMGTSFSIPDLAVGTFYNVTVTVNTGSAIYSGTALSSKTEDQAGSSTVTVKLELKSGTPEPEEPTTTEVTVKGGSKITVTGISNAAVESGELTLSISGISALSGATGGENLEFTLSSASEATMTEATLLVPNTALSSLNSLTWTGSAELGDASVTEVAITGEYQEGTLTISGIEVTGTVDVTFAGTTGSAIDNMTETSGTLNLDSSAIESVEGLTGTITVEMQAESKGKFGGTVTVPLSTTLGTTLTWKGSSTVGSQTVTQLVITGSQSETTYTVTAATATVQGA